MLNPIPSVQTETAGLGAFPLSVPLHTTRQERLRRAALRALSPSA